MECESKVFIYVILKLCKSFKISQTNLFLVVQERKVAAPLLKKQQNPGWTFSEIWLVMSSDQPLFRPMYKELLSFERIHVLKIHYFKQKLGAASTKKKYDNIY